MSTSPSYSPSHSPSLSPTTTTTTSTSSSNSKNKNSQFKNIDVDGSNNSSPDNNTDLSFKTCLNLLSSNVDEERFVGIILVKNLIKPDDAYNLGRVYDALGIEFLYRLLQTPTLPSQDSVSYHNVAVTILSTFTMLDISEIQDDQIESTIIYRISQHHLLPQIIESTLKNLIQCHDVNLTLFQESIMFLYSMLSFDSKLKDLCGKSDKKERLAQVNYLLQKEQNVKYVGDILLKLNKSNLKPNVNVSPLTTSTTSNQAKSSPDSQNIKMATSNSTASTPNKSTSAVSDDDEDDSIFLDPFKLLIHLIKLLCFCVQDRNESNLSSKLFKYFEPLLEPLSIIFKQINNPHRFSVLPILISVFQFEGFPSHPNNQSSSLLKSAENVRDGIASIFQSKTQKESHRDQTIIMFSLMMELLGTNWVMITSSTSSMSGDKLYLLANQYVRTEVQMILHTLPVTETISTEKTNLLMACYSIMDNVILFLVSQFESSDRPMLKADSLLQLRKILIDTNTLMIEYLKDLAEEAPDKEPTNVAILTLKQVGQFLAEEAESMSELLMHSLKIIFDYFLNFKSDYGFYLAYLLPGIENYIDVSSYTMTDRSSHFFNEQEGHMLLIQYLNNYLPVLVTMAIEQDQNILNSYPAITALKSYGCTPEIVGNAILPHACSILYFYLSYWSNPITAIHKGSFFTLFCHISDAIEMISININQALGDAHKDRQVFLINLILVSLSILKYLEEDDFTSTHNQETLNKAIDEYINFYQGLELPPPDQSSLMLWDEIKTHWLNSLDLLLQCLDKFPTLREKLSTNRWPPPDFSLPTNSTKMDSQTAIEVNRSISQIIRKQISLRNTSTSESQK